jgi:hypothetical protein
MRFRRLLLFLLTLVLAAPLHAQEDATRRALLERDQQSQRFSLELWQSQQRLRDNSPALERQQLNQRLQADRLDQQQLTRLPQETDGALSYERRSQRFGFEGQAPRWGPVLNAAKTWSPTLEPPPRPWTPTLQ